MGSSQSSRSEHVLTAIERLVPDTDSSGIETSVPGPVAEFDKQGFIAKMFDDYDLAREVAGLFLSYVPELVAAVRNALQHKNPAQLASAAQALKSSVANLGAEKILRIVRELETMGQTQNLSGAEEAFQRLESRIKTVCEVLTSVSGKLQSWKILISDDDPVSLRMLQATLMKWGHDPIVTPDGNSALRVLSSADPPRLAILDWMMPGLQGVEVCRELRKRKKSDYIYVILLTGREKTDDIIEGLDAGADDYMVKPFQPDELRIRVREGFRALDRLAGAHATTSEQDNIPSDLLGREGILVSLKKELLQSIQNKTPLSVMMIQLDSYAALRDDFGQHIADLAGKEVANIVQSYVKHNDVFGRYDSDTLLLVLPGCQESRALELARKVQSRLESAVVSSSDTMLPVTACLGITWGFPSSLVQVEHVISITEKAIKQAQGGGRNNLVLLRMDSQAHGVSRHDIEPSPALSRLDKELIVASRSGDLKRVKGLINSGARPDASDNKGNTALMEAAFFKYPEVVQLLVDEGADVTRHNNAGDSALIEAIRAGHADVAEVLLSRYSAAELREDLASLYRALVEASAYGKADVVKLVKRHLADHGCIPLKKKGNANP